MRKLLVIVVVAAFSALIPGTASAATPVVTHTTLDVGPFAITDVCSAGITVSGHLVVSETDYFGANGAPTRIYIHTVETDTFTGPARSLVSEPYEYGTFFNLDTSGNISLWSAGGLGRSTVTRCQGRKARPWLQPASPSSPKLTSAVSRVPARRPGALWFFQYMLVCAITLSGGGAPHSVRSSVVCASPTRSTS